MGGWMDPGSDWRSVQMAAWWWDGGGPLVSGVIMNAAASWVSVRVRGARTTGGSEVEWGQERTQFSVCVNERGRPMGEQSG